MRTFLKTSVLLAPDYEDEEIRLRETRVPLTLRLLGGRDQAVAEARVGLHKPSGDPIIAKLTFPYVTDILRERIETCANDHSTDLSPELVLSRGERPFAALRPHTLPDNALHLDAARQTLRSAHDSVWDSAAEQGIRISKSIGLGPYADKHIVYRDGCVSHIFDERFDDFDRCETQPFTSKYLNVVAANPPVAGVGGDQYMNVRHSTGDRYPATDINGHHLGASSSWITFWAFCVSGGTTSATRPICCYYRAGVANGHVCNATVVHSGLIYGCHSLVVPVGGPQPNADVSHARTGPNRPTVYIVAACNNSNSYLNTNTFIVQTATSVVEVWDYYYWD